MSVVGEEEQRLVVDSRSFDTPGQFVDIFGNLIVYFR